MPKQICHRKKHPRKASRISYLLLSCPSACICLSADYLLICIPASLLLYFLPSPDMQCIYDLDPRSRCVRLGMVQIWEGQVGDGRAMYGGQSVNSRRITDFLLARGVPSPLHLCGTGGRYMVGSVKGWLTGLPAKVCMVINDPHFLHVGAGISFACWLAGLLADDCMVVSEFRLHLLWIWFSCSVAGRLTRKSDAESDVKKKKPSPNDHCNRFGSQ